jgi:hypothetical protein
VLRTGRSLTPPALEGNCRARFVARWLTLKTDDLQKHGSERATASKPPRCGEPMTIPANAEPIHDTEVEGPNRPSAADAAEIKSNSRDAVLLSPVACGETSAEQYQEFMRNVKTNTHRAAREVVALYVAKNEEEHHA